VYRVNTFPLIHRNLLHTLFNILALAPLLERFETEFGTLTSLALFFGRQYICRYGARAKKTGELTVEYSFNYDPCLAIRFLGAIRSEEQYRRYGG